jgi:capsular exopolysaccharide synthesis family protein
VDEETAADVPVLRLGEVFGVLRRHLWLIAALGVLSAALTYWLVSRERPFYTATALIRLIDASQAMTQGVVDAQARGTMARTDPISSEMVVLSGRAVAGAVVDSLGLRLFDAGEQAPARWATAARVTLPADRSLTLPLRFGARSVTVDTGRSARTASYGDTVQLPTVRFVVPRRPSADKAELAIVSRDVAIDVVRAGLSPIARQGTSAIDVSYTSTRRQLAVDIVNRFITEYKALSASTERQQERQRVQFLAQQLAESEMALRSAQSELADFRSQQQVHRSSERFAAEQQTLAQIEMRAREHDSDQRTYQALLAELDKPGGSATALRSLAVDSNIAASPEVDRLFGELTALEATRDSLVATGKLPTYPLVKQFGERITGAESRLREAVRSQVTVLQSRVGELQEMHANSAAQMEKLSQAEGEEARLEQRAASVQQLWERLREEYQLARVALAVDVGKVQIIDVATRATANTTSRIPKLALGLAAGLLFGIGIAFARERMNTSIRRRTDIERVLRVPGLAVIPQMRVRRRWRMPLLGSASGNGQGAHTGNGVHARTNGSANGQSVIDNVTKGSSQAEVFRSLRTRLLLSHGSRALRVLVVTSAHAEDGKTTTTSNLAVAFAQQGFRVVIVDGDLRRPAIHTLFDVPREPGFADALMEGVTVDEAVHMSAISRLYVMPRGDASADAPDQLKGDRLTRVFSSLAKRFDLVLVDSPPLQAVPDAAILAAHADGVILVLRAGHTGRDVAQQAVDQLVDVGATVVGAVLNDPDAQASKYPDYSSRYSSGYAT